MVSKQYRISNETLEKLKEQGKPFESVDECLARILKKPCNTPIVPPEEDVTESDEDEE